VRLETTFAGAGVLAGDLTPECAAVVATVLDALSAPAGRDDDRTREQRYHDALAEAMSWLMVLRMQTYRYEQRRLSERINWIVSRDNSLLPTQPVA
jgi:Domain of unknown function (DUF222)